MTKFTVRLVPVAAETVPVAPLLKVTTLREGVVSKPNPLIVIEDALGEMLVVLLVIIGTILAT